MARLLTDGAEQQNCVYIESVVLQVSGEVVFTEILEVPLQEMHSIPGERGSTSHTDAVQLAAVTLVSLPCP